MKKYKVILTDEEREQLRRMISTGKGAALKLMHARILLKADASSEGPNWMDQQIGQSLEAGTATVERVRRQFVEDGLEAALERRKPDREYERRLDGVGEAHLIALACGQSPQGRERWTLQLLADGMVALGYVQELSRETVRRTLKKRVETVAEETVVHCAGEQCRVCVQDGRRAGRVSASVRSPASAGVPRRGEQAVDR